MTFIETILIHLKSRQPLIAIVTPEEIRCIEDVAKIAESITDGENRIYKTVCQWDGASGLRTSTGKSDKALAHPQAFFDSFDASPYDNTVFFMKDFGAIVLENEPTLVRSLKNVINKLLSTKSLIIFIGARFSWPPEIERYIVQVDYELPTEKEIRSTIDFICDTAIKKYKGTKDITATDQDRFLSARAARGLTLDETIRATKFSLAAKGALDVQLITQEKINAVKRSGLLEYVDTANYSIDKIGGLQRLKDYIIKRKHCYTDDAIKFGVKPPRSLLFLGIPGSGKSASAKTIGTILGLPTIKMEISSLMGSLVGESESRTKLGLAQITAISPCVCGDTIVYLPEYGSISAENLYNKIETNSKKIINGDDSELVLSSPKPIRCFKDGKSNSESQLLSIVRRKTTKLVIIKTDDGRTIKVTPNHRLLVKSGGKQQWKHAKYIKDGEDIVVA